MDRPDHHRYRPSADARADRARRPAFARRVVVVRVVRPSRRGARGRDHRRPADQRPSPCRAVGPCRKRGTTRTTPTCRCPSLGRRHRSRSASRPACTAPRSPCHDRGRARRSCCTSPAPRACMRCTSTVRSSDTGPTAGCPANTTYRGHVVNGRNDIAIVVIRYSARQLRRRSGPVVDGRIAPLRSHRIAATRAHRRRALRRRLRPGDRCGQRARSPPRSRSPSRWKPDGPFAPRCATRRVDQSGSRRQGPYPTRSRCRTSSPVTPSARSGRCHPLRRGLPRIRTSTRSPAS